MSLEPAAAAIAPHQRLGTVEISALMLVTAAGAGVTPARRERRPDEAEAIPEPV